MSSQEKHREYSVNVDEHVEFVVASCKHLSQSDLIASIGDGVIRYRSVAFLIEPDRLGEQALLDVSVELGVIPEAKRLSAYRHMASFNLSKGGEEYGALGFNPRSRDLAMHRVVFPRTEQFKPIAFASAIRALASHALDFRAAYVEMASGSDARTRFFYASQSRKGA